MQPRLRYDGTIELAATGRGLIIKTILISAGLLVMMLVLPIAAGERDYPARDLLAACGVPVAQLQETTGGAYHIGYCDGFVHAIGGLSLSGSLYCPPKAATADDARAVVVPYLAANPARLGKSRVDMLLEAYQAAWPCEDVDEEPFDRRE